MVVLVKQENQRVKSGKSKDFETTIHAERPRDKARKVQRFWKLFGDKRKKNEGWGGKRHSRRAILTWRMKGGKRKNSGGHSGTAWGGEGVEVRCQGRVETL